MICRKCDATSSVLSTRMFEGVIKRTRKCHNGHRFTTLEVLPSQVDRRTLTISLKHAVARERRAAVMRRPDLSPVQLAVRLGITDARVRQIRKEMT